MKVTQEKLPASQIGLEIEITSEITQKKYEQVIKNLANTVNIPGFRKGKVPRTILLQHLGINRVKAAALEELIPDGIDTAVKQEAIAAIGQPRLRSSFEDLISTYEPGKPLVISAAVDIQPEIKLPQYTSLQVKAEEVKYDPTRVDTVLEKERTELATLIPVEARPSQIGDIAVVDFKGVLVKTEGEDESTPPEPIPGGEATDFQVELQEDKFIPGFVTGMLGMQLGETREIAAQFPTPYANEALAGKAASFTVTLKEIKEKELPELNDDFAQEVSEFQTLAELRASLEEQYQKEAEEKTKTNQHEALMVELLQHTEVDLPATLIEQEVDNMLTQTAVRLSQQGLDVKKFFTQEIILQLRDRSRDEAIERIKRSLALQEVIKRESIEVKPAEIKTKVAEILQQYKDQDMDTDKLYSMVENDLLTQKTLDWLLEHSSVELVPEGSLSTTEETPTITTEDAVDSLPETSLSTTEEVASLP